MAPGADALTPIPGAPTLLNDEATASTMQAGSTSPLETAGRSGRLPPMTRKPCPSFRAPAITLLFAASAFVLLGGCAGRRIAVDNPIVIAADEYIVAPADDVVGQVAVVIVDLGVLL